MVADIAVRTTALPHPPRRLPFLGDVVGAHAATPVQDSIALAARLGPIFERVVLGRQYVLVSGADLAGELCDEQRFFKHVSPAIEGLRSIGGDGLFTAYTHEPNWQKAHDLLRPAFTQSAMRSYHEIMLDVASDLVTQWSSRSTVDVSSDMTKLTLDTIGRTGFSYGFDSFTRNKPHPFVDAMVGVLSHNQRRELVPIPWLADIMFARADRRNERNQRYLADVLDDIVRTRRDSGNSAARHSGHSAGSTPASSGHSAGSTPASPGHSAGSTPADLLDIMLDAARDSNNPNALSEVNIRQQILTFLIAGHETTSGALSFALYYLAQNPRILAAARAEVDEVWGTEAPAFEQIPKLRYVRRVLDETLRLWPTAPAFAREAREDTVIGGVHAMKKGDWAFVLIPGLHRDAVWGENTGEFDPNRFLSANVRARPGHVYKPWGTGERACIGRQFAIQEAVLVLGTILQKFDFDADPSYRLKIEERLTLMPRGFQLSLSVRK